MRCIIINPYTRRLEEVAFDGTLEDMYRLLSPPEEKPVTCFERVNLPGANSVYVDESGLLNDRKYGFRNPSWYPNCLSGIGIILGETASREEWADFAVMDLIETLPFLEMVEFHGPAKVSV